MFPNQSKTLSLLQPPVPQEPLLLQPAGTPLDPVPQLLHPMSVYLSVYQSLFPIPTTASNLLTGFNQP